MQRCCSLLVEGDIMKTKYALLTTELRRLCARMRRTGQMKLPGELELGERYGCSRQTVRAALSQLEQDGLIVRVRGSGTYLSDGRPGMRGRVAVITAYSGEYIYPQLLRDIGTELSPAGFELLQYSTGNRVLREREILTQLLRDPPAGILLEGARTALPSPNLELLTQLEQLDVPLVFLHAPLPAPEDAPFVIDDNEAGSRILVRRLLNTEHKKIAGIFKSDDRQGMERYSGFLAEQLEAGLPAGEENILWFSTEDRNRLMAGQFDWLDRFVHSRIRECTAAVCYNDEIAYALIRTLLSAGYRVPEDLAVVSFDNSHLCTLSPVPITSLTHERHQMGNTAAKALLQLMHGKNVRNVRLPWILKVLQSG